MRERGLKLVMSMEDMMELIVAPHAGAWIETEYKIETPDGIYVAPHAGAWIETSINSNISTIN